MPLVELFTGRRSVPERQRGGPFLPGTPNAGRGAAPPGPTVRPDPGPGLTRKAVFERLNAL